MIIMIGAGVDVILLMYLAINTINDWSKECNVICASQMIKDKDQGIQSQKLTFSVGNIYLACYDSEVGMKRAIVISS